MKAFSKKSLLASMLVMMMIVVAACGGNSPTPEPSKTPEPQKESTNTPEPAENKPDPVTISVYYPTPDRVEDRALEDDKIRRFQEKYPHVDIIKSDWQYKPEEIGIKMASGEAPTLFNTYATEGKMLVEKGWAADITNLFNNYEHKNEMNPTLQNQFIINGKVFGIAQRGYVIATVVNKKMLDEASVPVPPFNWSWDEMYETAKAITDVKKGISGIAPMGKGNEAGWNWTNFLLLAGGDIQAIEQVDGKNKLVAKFNSDAGLKALEFYHKLRWEGNVIPQDWALGWGDAVGSFAQGRTAMVIAGASDPIDQALNQGEFTMDDLLVYPMPASEKGGKHMGILGGDFLVINPNTTPAEQEAAFNYAVFDYFSDLGLESIERNIQERQKENAFFIPPILDYFQPDSEQGKKATAIYNKYDNVYKYDPEIMSLLDGKPEAQYSTQDYYAAMSNVIQEIFAKKNVDIKAELEAAAKLVQVEHFDKIEVE